MFKAPSSASTLQNLKALSMLNRRLNKVRPPKMGMLVQKTNHGWAGLLAKVFKWPFSIVFSMKVLVGIFNKKILRKPYRNFFDSSIVEILIIRLAAPLTRSTITIKLDSTRKNWRL